MKEHEVICPSCSNSVPFTRRCRKCWADLNTVQEIPEQTVSPCTPETDELQISLERSVSATEEEMLALIDDPFCKARSKNRMYSLKINDPSGKYPNRIIPLTDMGTTPGGITLSDWKITQDDNQSVLSVYLSVNMMGHDLDQWIHYDLMTGKELGRSVDQSASPKTKKGTDVSEAG
jgi:hypothetical protein